jgi:transcriptional regulator with XRE-family HTH domain
MYYSAEGGMRQQKRSAGDEPPSGLQDALFAQIAEQVYQQRVSRRLSQAELAALCGTAQSAIARIERGDRPPRIDTLFRIAMALDCELSVHITPRTTPTPLTS